MKVFEHAYVSDQIKHPRRVIRRFRIGKIIPGIFLVCLADSPDELEIIRADFFKQDNLRRDDRAIVAFTKNYDDAVDFVVDITQKSTDKYGFPELKRYVCEEF